MAQNLLKRQFPNLQGLNDVDYVSACTENLTICHIPEKKKYVQVLHTGNQHWICVCNINPSSSQGILPPNSVNIYDSLHSSDSLPVPSKVKKQLHYMLKLKRKQLKVNYVKVQQQKNSNDCGLFAIANAVSAAYNVNPQSVVYESERMRTHLVQCLQAKHMDMFPTTWIHNDINWS